MKKANILKTCNGFCDVERYTTVTFTCQHKKLSHGKERKKGLREPKNHIEEIPVQLTPVNFHSGNMRACW